MSDINENGRKLACIGLQEPAGKKFSLNGKVNAETETAVEKMFMKLLNISLAPHNISHALLFANLRSKIRFYPNIAFPYGVLQ